VLERQKVAEEVKGLDQPARATLRKYGVRFGAYHIYLPILLKPAPRALATQLWALKHESPDAKGVGELLHLAASGRTSIPVDKETPKPLYRTAGYRVAGERAVRVDILERLADLIRPTLSWRETSPGSKPDGVFDGRGFLVTGAMTSLTGASGEDFASILRSLGYRMDRRPKPAEPAEVKPVEPMAPPPAAVPVSEAAPSAEAPAAELPVAEVAAPSSAALLPEPELVSAPAEPPQLESPPTEVAAPEPEQKTEEKSEEQIAPQGTGDAPHHVEQKNSEAPTSSAAAEQPAFIEVWRPAGRFEKRVNRPRRPPRAPKAPVQAATPAATGETVAAAPADVSPAATPAETTKKSSVPFAERKDRQQRQDRNERQQRMERQGQRAERQGSGPPRRDRPPRRDKGDRVERAEREQYYAKPHGSHSDRRDKQPDPNSPFAKLAALKQQLEQNTKES
jgi:ATP-dependent RNA helicase SUPV3L1/SUV3